MIGLGERKQVPVDVQQKVEQGVISARDSRDLEIGGIEACLHPS
jgi:hypothetical protein